MKMFVKTEMIQKDIEIDWKGQNSKLCYWETNLSLVEYSVYKAVMSTPKFVIV